MAAQQLGNWTRGHPSGARILAQTSEAEGALGRCTTGDRLSQRRRHRADREKRERVARPDLPRRRARDRGQSPMAAAGEDQIAPTDLQRDPDVNERRALQGQS